MLPIITLLLRIIVQQGVVHTWLSLCEQIDTLYSNHLKTGLEWYSNGRFVFGCQMVGYTNGGMKTGLKKPVYGPKYQVFKWSVKSRDFTI